MNTKEEKTENVAQQPMHAPHVMTSPAPTPLNLENQTTSDAKENEMPAPNNFEFVRALDAQGNSIRISKADLVSVLEGLIDYKKQRGIIIQGPLPMSGPNKIGNPATVKYSCYGIYNNSNDGINTYAPRGGGYFIRMFFGEGNSENTTIFYSVKFGTVGLYSHEDMQEGYTQL